MTIPLYKQYHIKVSFTSTHLEARITYGPKQILGNMKFKMYSPQI